MKLSRNPDDYNYLALSNCARVESINDPSDWNHVQKALSILGFSNEDKQSMWRIIAAILVLGNVQFEQNPNQKDSHKVSIKNRDVVDTVGDLLGVPGMMLARVLTSRSIVTGVGKKQSQIHIPLDLVEVIKP